MKTQALQKLFSPLKVGPLTLSHRVVMAPLTRMRSQQPGDIPNDLMVEYYAQRASQGGLIISEATTISVGGRGYLGAPGIYSDEQVAGWKKVVDAIHAKGGYIFLQLWHVGRVSHVDMTNGATPIAPSTVPFEGVAFTKNGWVPVSPHRALNLEEIPDLIEDYRRAARRAKVAGFDGVELHGGNGYLLDQFIQDGTNKRTDAYGGPVENRARLLLEVLDAVVSVWGANRVGVRLSPRTQFNSMSDSSPTALFAYIGEQLNKCGLAYLHLIEPRIKGNAAVADGLPPVAAGELRKVFKGNILAAGGFEPDSAEAIIETGDADFVAFGRHFIANPDLPQRIQKVLPLTPYDRTTFYGGDARGYTDYPDFQEQRRRSEAQPSASGR
jgi:N-ethylmaleimide reductase